METHSPVDGFDQALAMVASCVLDADGRRSQKARYRTIAEAITGVRREPEVVLVDFGARLAPKVLEELLAVERDCCPSLRFEFDPIARRLSVAVADSAMLPALDAIAGAFAGVLR